MSRLSDLSRKLGLETDLLDRVPEALFYEYVVTIGLMERYRSPETVECYRTMERRRTELHDKICEVCGRSRGDLFFALDLGSAVEAVLKEMRSYAA